MSNDLEGRATEYVHLIRKYRNGQETSESLPRSLAELAMALIPYEEPNVASAWIRPIEVYPEHEYERPALSRDKALRLALKMAGVL